MSFANRDNKSFRKPSAIKLFSLFILWVLKIREETIKAMPCMFRPRNPLILSYISLRRGQNDIMEEAIEKMNSGLCRTTCDVFLTAMPLELLTVLKTSANTNYSSNFL